MLTIFGEGERSVPDILSHSKHEKTIPGTRYTAVLLYSYVGIHGIEVTAAVAGLSSELTIYVVYTSIVPGNIEFFDVFMYRCTRTASKCCRIRTFYVICPPFHLPHIYTRYVFPVRYRLKRFLWTTRY